MKITPALRKKMQIMTKSTQRRWSLSRSNVFKYKVQAWVFKASWWDVTAALLSVNASIGSDAPAPYCSSPHISPCRAYADGSADSWTRDWRRALGVCLCECGGAEATRECYSQMKLPRHNASNNAITAAEWLRADTSMGAVCRCHVCVWWNCEKNEEEAGIGQDISGDRPTSYTCVIRFYVISNPSYSINVVRLDTSHMTYGQTTGR